MSQTFKITEDLGRVYPDRSDLLYMTLDDLVKARQNGLPPSDAVRGRREKNKVAGIVEPS